MSLRVLHVHVTPGLLGGSERTLLVAVAGLREIGVENHLLYDGPPPPEPADFAGLVCEPPAFSPRQNLAFAVQSYRRIASYVRAHQIALIHVRLWASGLLFGALIRMGPVVATAHLPICPNGARFHFGDERPCEEAIGRVCLTRGRSEYKCGFTTALEPFGPLGLERGLLRAKWELRLLRACRFVMAPSEWQRRRLIRDGLPADRIKVVPSPVETAIVGTARSAPRTQPPIILFAARLVRFKGAHHMLDAVARLDTEVEVQIAGDGPESDSLKEYARQLGLTDRVTFLGPLGPGELRERYVRASVVAVPSLWPETFNRTGPEALAAGTPVVAYASGGVSEWLRPGVTGVSVPSGDVDAFADALREVISGDAWSELARRQGPAVAAEFSVSRHAKSVFACYEAALGQPSVNAV